MIAVEFLTKSAVLIAHRRTVRRENTWSHLEEQNDIYRSKPFPPLPTPHLTKTKDSGGTLDGCNETEQRHTNKVLGLPRPTLNPALVHDSHLISRLRLCVFLIIPVSSAFCFSASGELLTRCSWLLSRVQFLLQAGVDELCEAFRFWNLINVIK